jgi:hypothetical protein
MATKAPMAEVSSILSSDTNGVPPLIQTLLEIVQNKMLRADVYLVLCHIASNYYNIFT